MYFISILLSYLILQVIVADDHPLTLSVMLPLSSPDLDGRPYLPAMDIALELINNKTDLLPGFTLQAVVNDSACSAGSSVRSFIDTIFNKPTKVAMVGPICSTATQPVAELASFWNLVLISAGASNPTLSDTQSYPTFLRSVSPDTGVVDGIIGLMKQYGWSRVATITQQEFLFTALYSELNQAVTLNNLSEARNFQFGSKDNPQPQVEQLYNSPFRVVFLNMYPVKGIEIVCQAYHLGMTRENGYIWILFSWYGSNWWTRGQVTTQTYSPYNCSQTEREAFIEGVFLIDHFAFVEEDQKDIVTDLGLSFNQYFDIYNERLANDYSHLPNLGLATAAFTPLFVDAMWTIALALNETEKQTSSLKNFTYESIELRNIIYNKAVSSKFLGLSGSVSFKSMGDRHGYIRYFQSRRSGNSLVDKYIGTLDNSTKQVILRGGESISTLFYEGIVPTDKVFDRINLWIFGLCAASGVLGIVYALVWLILNIAFRNRKVIKLSSPYLNVVIILGAILFYIDLVLFGLDEGLISTDLLNGLCTVRIWIAVVAFTLLFGTLFAKTWRVYYIFHTSFQQKKSKKWIIRDGFLFLIIGVLLGLDCAFMIIITSVPGTRLELETTLFPSTSHALPVEISICTSPYLYHWLGALFAYKGLLLLVGLFLAFETRNVKIKELNDSHLIVMSVYATVVLSIAMTPIGIVLVDHVDLHYGLVGLLTMFGVTLLLSMLFVPKAYSLVKDPYGVAVFSQTAAAGGGGGGGGGGVEGSMASKHVENKSTIEYHQNEIDRLKREASNYKTNTNKSCKMSTAESSFVSLNSPPKVTTIIETATPPRQVGTAGELSSSCCSPPANNGFNSTSKY